MKIITWPVAVISTLALAGVARAQIPPPSVYGSVGYAEKNQSGVGSAQVRLGTRFGSYVGVEGEYAHGVSSHTDLSAVPVGPSKVELSLRHEAIAYLVGYLPLSPKADVFARVGYGETFYGIEVEPSGRKHKYHTDSLNLGVGAQYVFDGKNGLRFDYVRQELNVGRKQDVWAVAYTRRF